MPLIYSLVARGTVVLAEFAPASVSGNFQAVTRRILEKIPQQNGRMSYTYDRYVFHYLTDDGIVYLTMSDDALGRRIPFAFLEDIRNRFKTAYGSRARSAIAGAMNEEFSRVLQTQMDYYSNAANADKISKVREQIDEVQTIMVQNIERVLERGERIELLVDKTEALNSNALQFKKQSTNLRRAMFWKNVKMWLILAAVVLVIIYIIVAFVCGPFLGKCIHSGSSSSQPQPTHPPPPPSTTPHQ